MSGYGNGRSQSNDALLGELFEFCGSESLSEDGLRAIIERHGAAPNINDPNINNYVFHQVCINERVTEGILRYLLEYFPNAARRASERGQLPIHIICHNKNVTLGMVQLLIDAFPDSHNHEYNGGCIPLHALCLNKNLEDEVGLDILNLLVGRCLESVRHANRNGDLPIHIAAMSQSPEFCRVLIEAYPGSVQRIGSNGILPFHVACISNTVAAVKYLYQLYPESINVANSEGVYPIHFAIMGLRIRRLPKEGIKVMKFLLEFNPEDALSSTGHTPLHFACLDKNVTLNTVRLLTDAFPESLRHEDDKGHMPLYHLCLNNDLDKEVKLDVLKLLVEKCPESVRHADTDGILSIHAAAANESPGFCRILIAAYPRSERMSDEKGRLPFHAACPFNSVATVKYLLELYPESINVADNNGIRPIHYAILGLKSREDRPETAIKMVQFLLDCDPNLASQKYGGELPLYWVCNEATDENTRLNAARVNAYLKIVQILYDAYPEAVESNRVTSNVGSLCEEVQTFIRTQLIYARKAKDRTSMTTRDENGQLPLHRALRGLINNVTLGSIKLLVKGNPSAISCDDNTGMIPLHVACQHHESASVIEYLINLDPTTLQADDEEGNTVLHYACRGAKHATISLLLDKYGGISVSRRNAHNQLPIHLLLESKEVSDREDTKYLGSIYRLLRAYPETVMMGEKEESVSEGSLHHSGKKRKLGTE